MEAAVLAASTVVLASVAHWLTGTRHSVARLRRACAHTHSVDFVHSIVPAVIWALVTALVTLWLIKDDKPRRMDLIIEPFVYGLIAFAIALIVIHGGEFLYRYICEKAPHGSPRTLLGLDIRALETDLERAPHISLSVWMCIESIEVMESASEICGLLGRTGWNVGRPSPSGDRSIRDMHICVPAAGNPGLESLADFLRKHGYKVTVEHWGSEHAWIQVGSATH